MTRALGAALLVVGLSLPYTPVSGGQPAEPAADRGVLAVLRRDGIMFPFASFRGRTWQAGWPAALRNVELPINLQSIPERWWGGGRPDSWRAWFADGTSRELRAIAPVQFRVHCAARLGIRTDYRPAEPPPGFPVEPFPKDALAASAGVRVDPIEIVGRSDMTWGRLAVALLERFNAAEDNELSVIASAASWSHPVARTRRRGLPVKLEAWYRISLGGGAAMSYIEAVRSYPPGPEDDGCGLETLFGGWVRHEADTIAGTPDFGARVTYCDRVNASYMLPLGHLRLADRSYWVAQLSGHDAESYLVADVTRLPVRAMVQYFAGSRESCHQ